MDLKCATKNLALPCHASVGTIGTPLAQKSDFTQLISSTHECDLSVHKSSTASYKLKQIGELIIYFLLFLFQQFTGRSENAIVIHKGASEVMVSSSLVEDVQIKQTERHKQAVTQTKILLICPVKMCSCHLGHSSLSPNDIEKTQTRINDNEREKAAVHIT